jgi:hypothetical protein
LPHQGRAALQLEDAQTQVGLWNSIRGLSRRPGEIYLYDGSTVDLETFATFMGKGFNDWIVHFSACGTIGVEPQRLANFIATTNVAMMVGYKRDVDWMEGAALDLLLFSGLQYYKNMRVFWGRFKEQYAGLISATGLKVYHG